MSQFVTRPRPMLTAQRLNYDWGFGHGAGVVPPSVLVHDTDLDCIFMGDGVATGGIFVTGRTKSIHSADLTPATLSATAHNYNPPGIEKAKTLRLSASTIVTLTGLRLVETPNTVNEPGREISVINVGSSAIVLPGQNGGSDQGYQWGWNGIVLLEPGQGFTARVDGTSPGRLQMIGGPAAYTFSRIVAGGDSLLADQPGDTLTVVDRHGIGTLGISGTDTIELSAAVPVASRYQSDLYHTSPISSVGLQDVLCTANLLYAHPFFPAREATWTRIGVNVFTAAGGQSVRLGVYEEALSGGGVPKGQPGLLRFDAGTVTVGSTGWQEIVISQTLKPRMYWLVLVTGGTPTLKGLGITGNLGIGWDATFNRINHLTRATTGVVAGGLPADESSQTYSLVSSNHPAAFLRVV